MNSSIAFIGGGNMARSLIGGLLKQGWPNSQLSVSEPYAATREALAKDFPVNVGTDNRAAAQADIWLLAVKPQMMRDVCSELADIAAARAPLVISIAAGISLSSLRTYLGPKAALVRCMPNTPALIGAGITALYADKDVSAPQRSLAEQILGSAGSTVWLDAEDRMDAVTATSGSGPAYFFLLMEAMQAAAQAQGLSAETARQLVLQTAFGAAKMALESDESAATLRERVTSPGGTTAAALAAFEAGDFRSTVNAAIVAATERGRSLAKQFG